ncbi:MAG: tetratricopeptide repeat protein [Lentisphaeria bacterium]|nr:tetratricopeptide repeat protein [Lentisphaeria bacterium]
MTDDPNKRHMYKRLISLSVFALFIVGGTWAISTLKKKAEETAPPVQKTDFNGNVIRLELRSPMQPIRQQVEESPFIFRQATDREKKVLDPARILVLSERDMENGDFLSAEDRLRTALVFHGRNVKLHALLGKVLYLQEKYKEAEAVFRQQIYLDPENPVPMNNLSTALAKQKKFHEAIGTLLQLLKNDPSSASAVLNLAGMYAVSGDRKNALIYFRKAFELLGHRILFLAQDRSFNSLRQEKEFIRILEEAKQDLQKIRKEDISGKNIEKTKEIK